MRWRFVQNLHYQGAMAQGYSITDQTKVVSPCHFIASCFLECNLHNGWFKLSNHISQFAVDNCIHAS